MQSADRYTGDVGRAARLCCAASLHGAAGGLLLAHERTDHVGTCADASGLSCAVFRIRIHRIHVFLGLPDPDPLVRGMDPDPDPALDLDPSIIKQI
jgi:hypothetical protein